MGQFHIFSMIGYINHGLERQAFGFFKNVLQYKIGVMERTTIPKSLFPFIHVGPMLLFYIGLGNSVVIAEMAAHKVQDDKILFPRRNPGKRFQNIFIRLLQPFLVVSLLGNDGNFPASETLLCS